MPSNSNLIPSTDSLNYNIFLQLLLTDVKFLGTDNVKAELQFD